MLSIFVTTNAFGLIAPLNLDKRITAGGMPVDSDPVTPTPTDSCSTGCSRLIVTRDISVLSELVES